MHIKQTHKSTARPNLLKEHVFANTRKTEKVLQIVSKMTENKEHLAVTAAITNGGFWSIFEQRNTHRHLYSLTAESHAPRHLS